MLNGQWSSPPPFDPLQHTARKFDQLQAEILGAARSWAADEVGAVMAHQASDPLTALLLYLQQVFDMHERLEPQMALPASLKESGRRALREAERLCDIMRRANEPDRETAAPSAASGWGAQRQGAQGVRRHTLLDILTPREREVLALVTRGCANEEGALQLGISKRTFEVHRAHIMEKLKARNAADLVRMALSESL